MKKTAIIAVLFFGCTMKLQRFIFLFLIFLSVAYSVHSQNADKVLILTDAEQIDVEKRVVKMAISFAVQNNLAFDTSGMAIEKMNYKHGVDSVYHSGPFRIYNSSGNLACEFYRFFTFYTYDSLARPLERYISNDNEIIDRLSYQRRALVDTLTTEIFSQRSRKNVTQKMSFKRNTGYLIEEVKNCNDNIEALFPEDYFYLHEKPCKTLGIIKRKSKKLEFIKSGRKYIYSEKYKYKYGHLSEVLVKINGKKDLKYFITYLNNRVEKIVLKHLGTDSKREWIYKYNPDGALFSMTVVKYNSNEVTEFSECRYKIIGNASLVNIESQFNRYISEPANLFVRKYALN